MLGLIFPDIWWTRSSWGSAHLIISYWASGSNCCLFYRLPSPSGTNFCPLYGRPILPIACSTAMSTSFSRPQSLLVCSTPLHNYISCYDNHFCNLSFDQSSLGQGYVQCIKQMFIKLFAKNQMPIVEKECLQGTTSSIMDRPSAHILKESCFLCTSKNFQKIKKSNN